MPRHSRRVVRHPLTFDDWWDDLPAEERRSLDPHRKQLRQAFRKPQRADVRWWYTIGTCLVKLSAASKLPRAPGLIEVIADKIEPGRDPSRKSIVTRLYQCRELAQKFSWKQVVELAGLIRKREIRLQHVVNLLNVTTANTKSPEEFLAACRKGNWSSNELRRQIQDDKRGGLESRGGRRTAARPTANPAVAARVISNQTAALLASCEAYFNSGRAPLGKPLRKPTPELMIELEIARRQLQEAGKAVQQAQQALVRLRRESNVKV